MECSFKQSKTGMINVFFSDLYNLHGKTFETYNNGYIVLNANCIDKEIKVEIYNKDDWCLSSSIDTKLDTAQGLFLFLEHMKVLGYNLVSELVRDMILNNKGEK